MCVTECVCITVCVYVCVYNNVRACACAATVREHVSYLAVPTMINILVVVSRSSAVRSSMNKITRL